MARQQLSRGFQRPLLYLLLSLALFTLGFLVGYRIEAARLQAPVRSLPRGLVLLLEPWFWWWGLILPRVSEDQVR